MSININVLSIFDGISCGRLALQKAGIEVGRYYSSEIDKFAIKCANDNWPQDEEYRLGDVTKVKGENLPKIDLLMGGSPCFVAGSFVMTKFSYKPIEEIKEGDYVLTHMGRFRKVLKTGFSYKHTITFKSQGSTEITTTENHPFYCISCIKKWNSNIKNFDVSYTDFYWKNISSFEKSDKVVSLKWNRDKDNEELSDMDLYVLGRFLADGFCYKTKRKNRKNSYSYSFKISVGKHEIEDFKNKVDDRFSYVENRTAYYAYIQQEKWYKLGRKFGKYSHNKYIPNFILDLPQKRLRIFLRGYMDGDGCVLSKNNKNNTYIYDYKKAVTVSEKLALTLSLAIQKCYYGVSIRKTIRPKTKVIEGRTVNQRDDYQVSYTEDKSPYSKFIIKNNYVAYNITKNKLTNNNIIRKVYNLEVEEDNSYIVNNLIVHNCQGFSFAGKQLNFEDPRSKLFFEFVRLIKECEPKYFLLENVKMKEESKNVITNMLGVEPIEINSDSVSAQNRPRLYWTNIPNVIEPQDKGIWVRDILEYEGTPVLVKNQGKEIGVEEQKKSCCLLARDYKGFGNQGMTGVLTGYGSVRRLTPIEYERLQTVPDNYTSILSNTQRYKTLGNGWTVDVIAHILSFMKMDIDKNE